MCVRRTPRFTFVDGFVCIDCVELNRRIFVVFSETITKELLFSMVVGSLKSHLFQV
jgi:hypothetical protein